MKKYQFDAKTQILLESMKLPFAVYQYVNKRVITLVVSDGFCELFGYVDRAQAYYDMDNNMYYRTHPDDVARVEEAAIRFATEDVRFDVIYRSKKKVSSEYSIIHSIGTHTYTDDGTRLAYVYYTDEGLYSENECKKGSKLNEVLGNALREESLLKRTSFDYLTGLPNMTYFFELSEAGRDAIIADGGKPAMLYLDLCGLKYFNHKFGFAAGDKLLQSFAEAIVGKFGSENCSHIGQDHFAAISNLDGLEEKIKELFAEFKESNSGNTLPVRVGIYCDKETETVPVSVACDRAKLACDSLRGTFESEFCYYRHELIDGIVKKQYILSNFEKALKEEYIEVYYQAIVRAVNDKVCDEEALSRWNDPVEGLLSPADFIPILEDAKLIYKLDLYVLDHVLKKLKLQEKNGITIVPNSINLSRSDFDVCDIVEEVRRRVDEAGISRENITIEITESSISNDFDFMKSQIKRFKDLGFPVWMDDFGSGYSSLDMLQNINFDLIKFDMSFLKKLDDGDSGKIILSQLMRMAVSLGLDTVCEGVESESHVRFLKEIGCSKLQGYYYSKPVPFEKILERYKQGKHIGFENPEESDYYKVVGGINLYDLSAISGDDDNILQNSFNTLPMGVIEIKGDTVRFVSSNESYRNFIKRFFGYDLSYEGTAFTTFNASFLQNIVKACNEHGSRALYDETMPDGSIVHSFARRISVNPVNGSIAIAVAVISITDANEGTTYASIARALAADYYNIYYVDLDTERFIEYTSPVGEEELAMERHGENFFKECRDAAYRIYEEDRAPFFSVFSKENVIRELDEQGVFTATYRLMDTGTPMYVNMKITRMQRGGNRIIMGVSIIDAQMKHKEYIDEIKKERDALARVMALSEGYLSLYTINPETGEYYEYSSTKEYQSLGFSKGGDDFFEQGRIDGKRSVYKDDLPLYLKIFTKKNVINEIHKNGVFNLHYRLVINGEPRQVSLRIAAIMEEGKEKLVAGVRAWKERRM